MAIRPIVLVPSRRPNPRVLRTPSRPPGDVPRVSEECTGTRSRLTASARTHAHEAHQQCTRNAATPKPSRHDTAELSTSGVVVHRFPQLSAIKADPAGL